MFRTLLAIFVLSQFITTASAQTVLFEDDLATDEAWTGGIDVTGFGGETATDSDAAVEFGFDYSVLGIPPAPNGDDSIGLRIEVNNNVGEVTEAALVHADPSFDGQFTVEADIWINYPFDAAAVGTTEFAGAGVGHDGFFTGGVDRVGASLWYAGDGGATRDYRLYKDGDEQFPASGQYALGTAVGDNDNGNPILTKAFPPIEVDQMLGDLANIGTVPFGGGGFQWMTMKVVVDTQQIGSGITEDAGIATFYLRSDDSELEVEIGTVDNSNGGSVVNMGGSVALYMADLFTSIAVQPEFSFALFDNVKVTRGLLQTVDGDFNNDGFYDCLDIDSLVGAIAANTDLLSFDLSADGTIDLVDVVFWLIEAGNENQLEPYPYGDVNLDGNIDSVDLAILEDHLFDNTAAWCSGDLTADGGVDVRDFNVWNEQRANLGGGAAVPEPLGVHLMLFSAILLLTVRKKE